MAGIQINDAKAPYVMFERRAEEDRNASIEAGRYVTKDVDYALITPHGSRDQIERVVSEWFDHLRQQVQEGRFEQPWFTAYQAAYENWKAGKEIPLEGTPIVNWPVLSPSQVHLMQGLHILTVEVLANANEETIQRLGMGGRSLVERAKEFLKQADKGKTTEELVALRQLVTDQKAMLDAMNQQLKAVQMTQQGQKQAEPYAEPESAGISKDDLFDKTTPAKRKL